MRPWGFILFKRNVETPDQVKALTAALRETIGEADAPVLIDQEGGRVQRLVRRTGPAIRPAGPTATLAANDPLLRREIARLGARLMAHDLAALGINVDCVPVLDVPEPGAHDIIGDRAYGQTADEVALLGRAAAEGLIAGGVLPVMKHVPGHGRSQADSHLHLPVVDASREALAARDFAPFQVNSDMPMAMTAHVVFSALGRPPSGHDVAQGDPRRDSRRDRFRRPADDRRLVDEGAERRFRRPGSGGLGRRLRHRPALQRPDGGG